MKTLLAALFLALASSAHAQTWRLLQGQHSGVTERRAVVVQTEADWRRLWSEHDAAAPAPEVDFSKESVVAVFGGRTATAGARIVLVVQRDPIDPSRVTVFYRETRVSGGFSAQVECEPFAFVKVERAAVIDVERDAAVRTPERIAPPDSRRDERKMKALIEGFSNPSFDGN